MKWILILCVPAFLALMIWGAVVGKRAHERRIRQKRRLARRLGCDFHEDDPYRLAQKFERTFESLRQGDNRYAYNVMTGRWRDRPIWIFDHHHETTSTDSDGNSDTDHHYSAYIVIRHDFECAPLDVRRGSFLDGIGSLFGFEDIEFESKQFNDRWHVHSKDRQFAYELFDPLMIEYFGTLERFTASWRESWGLYHVPGGLGAYHIRRHLRRVRGFLKRIPRFVRKDYARS